MHERRTRIKAGSYRPRSVEKSDLVPLKSRLLAVLALFVLATLSACGGGGGGGGGTSPDESPGASPLATQPPGGSTQPPGGQPPGGPTPTPSPAPTPPRENPPAPQAWGTPGEISEGMNPSGAVDSSGNAFVVWSEGISPEGFGIFARRFSAGSGWGPETRVDSQQDPGRSLSPKIVVDGKGNALALWLQTAGNYHLAPWEANIWAKRYSPATGWGTAQLIGKGGPWGGDDHYSQLDPRIVLDAAGNATAVWISERSVRAAHYTADLGWAPSEIISSRPTFHPQIAGNSRGDAVAVWWQSVPRDGVINFELWSNRYTSGRGWGVAERIQTENVPTDLQIRPPSIVQDDQGNILAVWVQQFMDGSCKHTNVWAKRFTPHGGWGAAEILGHPPGPCGMGNGYTAGPLVVDGTGNALAMWLKSDGIRATIWWNRYAVGTGWGPPIQFETKNSATYFPDLTMQSNGNALALWGEDKATGNQIWTNTYTASAGWGIPTRVETGSFQNAWGFQLATNREDRSMGVWMNAPDAATPTRVWVVGF